MPFQLHPLLERDTIFMCDLTLSQLLLKNDERFPWLILVPKVTTAIEIHELSQREQAVLLSEINQISKLLQSLYKPDKLNIASIGNIVPQLHIHLVARYKNDSAWPAPIWGFDTPIPYPLNKVEKIIQEINNLIN